METVNFPCSQCNNLMAVGTDLLGHQVRCPHCQQVMTAPAAAAADTQPARAEAAAPAPTDPHAGELESIFAPPEPASDDLFGAPAPVPVVQLPPAWPNFQIEGGPPAAPPPAAEPLAAAPEVSTQETFGAAPNPAAAPTATFLEPSSATDGGFPQGADEQPAAASAGDWPGAADVHTATESASDLPARTPERRPRQGRGLGLILVLIFLVPYSLFATAAAVYFYLQKQRMPNPFEALPDWPGDKPGATRRGHSSVIMFERLQPDTPLPPKLRVALHQPITVGDLEITPEKVERRRLVHRYENSNREPATQGEALVLTLHLRNVSADDYFVPTDAHFYRRWTESDAATTKPYTFLEVGARRFYGGPLDWEQRSLRNDFRREEDPREYITGQENYKEVLKPGQERRVIICSDEDPDLLKAAREAAGQLLWRVQLRRGLVQARGHEVSASAVVGVEFARQDVKYLE